MKIRFLIFVLALALLALSACSPAGGAEPAIGTEPAVEATVVVEATIVVATDTATPEPPTTATAEVVPTEEPAVDTAAVCPEPAEGTELLQHQAYGYCLLYPDDLDAVQTSDNGVSVVAGSLLASGEHPRLDIAIQEAGGRSLEQVAEEFMAGYEGFELGLGSAVIGGIGAAVLDDVPGQDINRVVLIVHDDRLYELRFSPASEDAGDAFTRMEELSQVVMESLTFVPVVPGAPLQAGPECPEPTGATELLRNEEHGYCLLYPAGFSTEASTETQTTLFVDSLMNTEDPKLFIEVTDAGGRTAEEIVDEVAAEFGGGFDIERTFGLLLGGEPASMLDKVPGQDLSRQIFAVHNGRLYKLTFAPSDEAMGEVYTEMEALYELVTESFSFLAEE